MGLFDSLAKQALGGMMGAFAKPEQGADALSQMLEQIGGLEGLKSKFEGANLGEAFSSWTGTGENQAVAPNQMEGALGSDLISGLAGKFGLQGSQLLPLLAQFLPMVIDRLTPQGGIDTNQPSSDQLKEVLEGVMKEGLGGLFGGK